MAVEGVAGRVVPDRRDPMASGSVASDPEPPMAVPDHGGLVWATTHEGCVLRDTAGWTGEVAVTSGSPEIDQWRRGSLGTWAVCQPCRRSAPSGPIRAWLPTSTTGRARGRGSVVAVVCAVQKRDAARDAEIVERACGES